MASGSPTTSTSPAPFANVPATSPPAPAEVATDAIHGWAAIQRAVEVTLTRDLAQAESVDASTLNLLSGLG